MPQGRQVLFLIVSLSLAASPTAPPLRGLGALGPSFKESLNRPLVSAGPPSLALLEQIEECLR